MQRCNDAVTVETFVLTVGPLTQPLKPMLLQKIGLPSPKNMERLSTIFKL